MRTMTIPNCQTRPAVRLRMMARGRALDPSNDPASQGATTQARAAIGSAAAAQVPRIRAREYWGSGIRAGSVTDGAVGVSRLAWLVVCVMTMAPRGVGTGENG